MCADRMKFLSWVYLFQESKLSELSESHLNKIIEEQTQKIASKSTKIDEFQIQILANENFQKMQKNQILELQKQINDLTEQLEVCFTVILSNKLEPFLAFANLAFKIHASEQFMTKTIHDRSNFAVILFSCCLFCHYYIAEFFLS